MEDIKFGCGKGICFGKSDCKKSRNCYDYSQCVGEKSQGEDNCQKSYSKTK